MYSNGTKETQAPGHCALVVKADIAANMLHFVQSGSDQGGGPEFVKKHMAGTAETTWKTRQSAGGLGYLSMGDAVENRFICVRPKSY